MNATERVALAQSLALHDELSAVVDSRTLEILERRRSAGVVRRRGWLVRRALAAADIAGLALAFLIAQSLVGGGERLTSADESFLFLATLPAWIVVAKLYGLYDRDEERTDHSTADDVIGVFHMVTVGAWLFYAGARLTGLADPQLGKVFVFWLLAVALVSTSRGFARSYCRRHVAYIQNTIIVGAGQVGRQIARKLLKHPEYGINLVGVVDRCIAGENGDLAHLRLLGDLHHVPELVRAFDIERVIVAFPNQGDATTLELVRELNELDVQVDLVPRLHEVLSPAVDVHTVEGLPLIGLRPPRLSRSSAFLKRSLDVIGAGFGLFLLAPLLALIAAAIKFDSRGPVLFRQTRMGAGRRTFQIFKFRTMAADADARKREFAHLNKHLVPGGDARMFKIDDDPRVTRVGRWLRRLSLDELPQLWNVVRGEMSLVGPRPLILDEHAHVADWGGRRLDLKPGITGLWQVLGRDEIPFAEMVALDYLYVTGWSLGGDLRLLLRTIPLIFTRPGT